MWALCLVIKISAWARFCFQTASHGDIPGCLGGGSDEVGQTPAVSFSLSTPIQIWYTWRADKSHRFSKDQVVGRPKAIVSRVFSFEELVLGDLVSCLKSSCVFFSASFSLTLFCTRGSWELQSDLKILFYHSAVSTITSVLFFGRHCK